MKLQDAIRPNAESQSLNYLSQVYMNAFMLHN